MLKKSKKTVLLFFLFLQVFLSCKDDIMKNDPFNYNVVTDIAGKIFDLPTNAKMIKAIIQLDFDNFTLDSTIVDSSNYMFLNLITPPLELLHDIDVFFVSDTNIIISNYEARANFLLPFAFDDSSGNFVGLLIKDNHNLYPYNAGYFRVSFIYCDRNVRISGKSTTINNLDTTYRNYSVNLGVGWNVLTYRLKVVRQNYIESELYNGETAGGIWYFDNQKVSKAKIDNIGL